MYAIDEDEGTNGFLTYSIAFGNTGNMFAIGATNGAMTNNGVINRESVSKYTLQIAAVDGMRSILLPTPYR